MNTTLKYTIGTDQSAQFDGWTLDVNHPFDVSDYAEHAHLNVSEIDADSIKAVQDAQSQLNADEWISIDHDTDQ